MSGDCDATYTYIHLHIETCGSINWPSGSVPVRVHAKPAVSVPVPVLFKTDISVPVPVLVALLKRLNTLHLLTFS